MNKKQGHIYGQAMIGLLIFLLNYTYFYHSRFGLVQKMPDSWGTAMFLSFTAVLTGMLIELGRLWGWPMEVKIDRELLVLQGTPAALLGVVPAPFWLDFGGLGFPYVFFADPVVTAVAGVWLGVILLRSVFVPKKIKEDEQEEKRTEHNRHRQMHW